MVSGNVLTCRFEVVDDLPDVGQVDEGVVIHLEQVVRSFAGLKVFCILKNKNKNFHCQPSHDFT